MWSNNFIESKKNIKCEAQLTINLILKDEIKKSIKNNQKYNPSKAELTC
jgi:hypothetical protein